MDNEVKGAFEIALEILIFSLLVLIIFFFSSYSRNAFVLKSNQDMSRNSVIQYRKVYQFTMGKEITTDEITTSYANYTRNQAAQKGNIVTGDDIVRLLGLYPQEFNVYITNRSSKKAILRTDDIKKWDMSDLGNWLGSDISNEFYCVFVFDKTQYIYDAVIFISKNP